MGRCRFRPLGYRIGLGFMILGCVLVALGYGFPTWVRVSRQRTRGLWHLCGQHWSSCALLPADHVLLVVVRSLVGGCLFFYLVSFTMALRENCCSPNFYTCCLAGRKTEIFAFLSELLGITGMILFSVEEYETVGDFNRLSWAHALCDFGLAVSLIGSIMMACSQHSVPPAKSTSGRMVAKPQGYESLANNANNYRSSSLQSHSTHHSQPSPFQGRTTPRVSGPFPSPAAIAAVTAAVSPKQHRLGGMSSLPTSPLHRKLSSPASYPALDPLCSPARRRKSSAQSAHFAGVHNQSKHPPVFMSQQMQDAELRMQQSATWSEDMRVQEDGAWQQHHQGTGNKGEDQQSSRQHAGTWGAAVERERSWTHSVHGEHLYHDRDRRLSNSSEPPHSSPSRLPPSKSYSEHYNTSPSRMPPSTSYSEQYKPTHSRLPSSTSYSEHYTTAHSRIPPSSTYSGQYTTTPCRMPPSSAPPTVSPIHYGSPFRENLKGHLNTDRRQAKLVYQYSDPGCPTQPPRQRRRLSSHQYQEQQQRPSSGDFPDPPPPDELLCYEEERPTDTLSYHGYPNPIPGELATGGAGYAQHMVLYHDPSHTGLGAVTETITIPHHHNNTSIPYTRSTLPNMASQQQRHSLLHQHHQQNAKNQTFPRQQASYLPTNPHAYLACER